MFDTRKNFIAFANAALGGAAVCYSSPVKLSAALPYVLYSLVSATPDTENLTERTVTQYAIQLDIYADNYAAADMLRDLLVAAFDRPGETVLFGVRRAYYCRVEQFRETTEMEQDGTDDTIVRYTLEINITMEN